MIISLSQITDKREKNELDGPKELIASVSYHQNAVELFTSVSLPSHGTSGNVIEKTNR